MDWIQWRKVHFPADSVGDKWPIFAYPHESPLTPTHPHAHIHKLPQAPIYRNVIFGMDIDAPLNKRINLPIGI